MVLQYHPPSCGLNLRTVHLARTVHGDLVPTIKQLESIGGGSSMLNVYELEWKPGVPYIYNVLEFSGGMDGHQKDQLEQTIRSLAK
jgi:hypothetical protein